MFPEIENFFWRAKGEGNKDQIKKRPIFFELSGCNFQSGTLDRSTSSEHR